MTLDVTNQVGAASAALAPATPTVPALPGSAGVSVAKAGTGRLDPATVNRAIEPEAAA